MIIKKLNTVFHKHSRILFGAFTLLIIVAFTDFLTPGNRGGCSGAAESTAGTAFGKKVSYKELADFGRNISVAFMLSGRQIEMPNYEQLFNYYCLIKRAEQLGLSAGNDEIAAVITANPAFRKDGKFDSEAYDKFLKQQHLTDSDVAAALRLRLMEEKLMQLISRDNSVTDSEAEAFYQINNGVYTLKICQFESKKIQVAQPSDAQISNFYETNKKQYTAPGSFEAVSAEIPYKSFEAAAAKAVTDADVKSAIASGNFNDANGKALKADEVKKQLVTAKCAELASRFAGDLFRSLYKALEKAATPAEQLNIFRNWAADKKLLLSEHSNTVFGSRTLGKAYLPKICAELQNMPESGLRVTRPESGGNGIYIAILKNRTAPRQQKLDEVKALVTKDFIAETQLKAAIKIAETEAAKIAQMDKKSAADAFDKLNGSFTTLTFPDENLMKTPEKMQLVYAVAAQLPNLVTGDISRAQANADGAVIAKVIKRAPADMSKFPAQKEMLKSQLTMMKNQQAWMRFTEEISSQCRFFAPENQAE